MREETCHSYTACILVKYTFPPLEYGQEHLRILYSMYFLSTQTGRSQGKARLLISHISLALAIPPGSRGCSVDWASNMLSATFALYH